MHNYNEFWKQHSSTSAWREYILPKRSDKSFFDEGKLQADILNGEDYFNSDSTILEFGCGIARVLKYINVPHENKIGVDVCQAYLDKIEEPITKIKTDGIRINEVNDESVDFIYSLMVLQHINKRDHIHLLDQLYSFLKPGGKMLIQFPMAVNEYYTPSNFVNLYTESEVRGYFKNVTNLEVFTGNLVGYGDGLVSDDINHREYFALITK